jgi:hypothetical protein
VTGADRACYRDAQNTMISAQRRKLRQIAGAREPRRALLAWEYGAGHTHAVNMLAVAEKLRNAGVTCVAALYDLRRGAPFARLGIPTLQNYIWPQARRWAQHDGERPYVGFLDVLGNLGFGEADWVAAALAHYDGLFDLYDPDLVLAENAYGAQLAARGRIPTIAFGFGQYLPAIRAGAFAFPEDEPTSWTAQEVLAGLNRGLERTGRAPLMRLEEMFDIEAVFPFGPSAFDRNAPLRDEPAMPVHVRGFQPGLPARSGQEIFVYLQGSGPRAPSVMAALLAVRRPIRAHVLDLDPYDRALLAGSGVVLEDEALPIAEIIERSRCVLHHGGVGLTAACLSAGLPQVILSKQPDHRASGEFVEAKGLGEHRAFWDATTGWIVDATRRAYDDERLRSECRARAAEFDAWFEFDPTDRVAAEACRLIGIAPPSRLADELEARPLR